MNEEDLFTALKGIYQRCQGGYSCVAMLAGKSLCPVSQTVMGLCLMALPQGLGSLGSEIRTVSDRLFSARGKEPMAEWIICSQVRVSH